MHNSQFWVNKKFSDTPRESSRKRGVKGSIFQKSAKKCAKKTHLFEITLEKDTTPGQPLYSILDSYVWFYERI